MRWSARFALCLAVTAACGDSKKSPKQVTLDPAALRAASPETVCLELGRKLTDCGSRFATRVRLALTARGIPPDEATILADIHTVPPGAAECHRMARAATDRVLGCYSNDCAELSACVLGEPRALPDTSAAAPRCADGASPYRSSDNKVRWCARPDGTPHGIWDARAGKAVIGAGTFRDGKRHGRFQLADGTVRTYGAGHVTAVGDAKVAAMKSTDIDVAISLRDVERNTSAVTSAAMRAYADTRGKAALMACADELRLRDRFPGGVALVVAQLNAEGVVLETAARSLDPQLSACLSAKVKTWRMPPAPTTTKEAPLRGRAYLVFQISTVHVPD
jgi:hypothetical protein